MEPEVEVFDKGPYEPPPKPFTLVSVIHFKDEGGMNAYVGLWHAMSQLIHQEVGANGARLHRVQGETTVLVVAEWKSREARVRAFKEMREKYPPDHTIWFQAERFGGEYTLVVEADEIDAVFP